MKSINILRVARYTALMKLSPSARGLARQRRSVFAPLWAVLPALLLGSSLALPGARAQPAPAAPATTTALATTTAPQPAATANAAQVSIYFSPRGGATGAIVSALSAATKTIDVQAYGFTSPVILDALKKAHDRGVRVRITLDRTNQSKKYNGATFMSNAGVRPLIDTKHKIAHSKVLVIDAGLPGATVVTGSFNFSDSAENNNLENLLVLKNCPDLARAYTANWEANAATCKPYVGPADAAGGAAPATGAKENGENEDGENEDGTPATTAGGPGTPTAPGGAPVTPGVGALLNINTATEAQMAGLPVSATVRRAIIAYREANGPFKTLKDLDKVPGIGPATLAKLGPLVTF